MEGPHDLSGEYCSHAQVCLELVTTLWASPVNTTLATWVAIVTTPTVETKNMARIDIQGKCWGPRGRMSDAGEGSGC